MNKKEVLQKVKDLVMFKFSEETPENPETPTKHTKVGFKFSVSEAGETEQGEQVELITDEALQTVGQPVTVKVGDEEVADFTGEIMTEIDIVVIETGVVTEFKPLTNEAPEGGDDMLEEFSNSIIEKFSAVNDFNKDVLSKLNDLTEKYSAVNSENEELKKTIKTLSEKVEKFSKEEVDNRGTKKYTSLEDFKKDPKITY
jgi:hypothetical protein